MFFSIILCCFTYIFLIKSIFIYNYLAQKTHISLYIRLNPFSEQLECCKTVYIYV